MVFSLRRLSASFCFLSSAAVWFEIVFRLRARCLITALFAHRSVLYGGNAAVSQFEEQQVSLLLCLSEVGVTKEIIQEVCACGVKSDGAAWKTGNHKKLWVN